jgi:hypothetical protein
MRYETPVTDPKNYSVMTKFLLLFDMFLLFENHELTPGP